MDKTSKHDERKIRFKIGVLVIVMSLAAVSMSHLGGQQDDVWRVSPVVAAIQDPEFDSPEWLLWIGLKNKSESARLICLGSWGYTFRDPEDPQVGAEGSPHTCRTRQSFGLVLPGETRFVTISVGPADVRYESTTLSVDLSLFESQDIPLAERRKIQLTWEGTVEDALRAGRQLLKR